MWFGKGHSRHPASHEPCRAVLLSTNDSTRTPQCWDPSKHQCKGHGIGFMRVGKPKATASRARAKVSIKRWGLRAASKRRRREPLPRARADPNDVDGGGQRTVHCA
jgi:hypothetical protein